MIGCFRGISSDGQRLGLSTRFMETRRDMEKKQSMMGLVMIVAFIVAWFPYAVCVLILTVHAGLAPSFLISAAVFAKMSSLYNPIIYLVFMGKVGD